MDRLSPGERALAGYMLNNVEELAFLSALEVANAAATSNASVTRLSQRLGYRGYVDLQKTLRVELRKAYSPSGPPQKEGFVAEYWHAESRALTLATQIPESLLRTVGDLLASSPRVWLGGAQTMRPLATYGEYYLSLFRSRVHVLVEDLRTRPDGVLDVESGDVAMLFTVRRYSTATRLLGDALLERGASLVVVTDDGAPSLARHAQHVIRVPMPTAARTPSVTMLVSVVQLLGLLVAAKLGNDRTELAEEYISRYGPYEY